MSDGPHKSLPMKRKWRNVAERADKRVFEVDEISVAMVLALTDDCREEMSPGFIEHIRGIYEEQESLLIKDNLRGRVEALRLEAGSGIGVRLIEYLLVRISSGDAPEMPVLVKAMKGALEERAAKCTRQVEEHYQRKSTVPRTNNVRTRLEQGTANAALEGLARQVLKIDGQRPSHSSAKRDGLDEGPSIR